MAKIFKIIPYFKVCLLVTQSTGLLTWSVASTGHFPSTNLVEFNIVHLDIERQFWHPNSERTCTLNVAITSHQSGVSGATNL